jgi:hypothetical protein
MLRSITLFRASTSRTAFAVPFEGIDVGFTEPLEEAVAVALLAAGGGFATGVAVITCNWS